MKEAAYPLDKPLPVHVMAERLARLGPALHAIACARPLDPSKAVHILAKDNIGVSGMPTTAGSSALRSLMLPDAPCVANLKAAGFDVFGKTTMTELAGFVTTGCPRQGYSELGGFGVNPHGDFSCGGSSSGSGIAVAAGLCDAALGTETRGSLMKPGLQNGVWSFKPSRGLASRRAVVPLSSSFDTIGVLARNTGTLRAVAQAMRGVDPEDRVTLQAAAISLQGSLPEHLRLAWVTLPGDSTAPGKLAAQTAFRKKAEAAGIEFIDVVSSAVRFDYKLVTSQDIMRDMDAFLARYGSCATPRSFQELLDAYRKNPASHPFGMDRLEDAAAMERMDAAQIDALAAENTAAGRRRIESILRETGTSAIVRSEWTDWWSIGGAPEIAVPAAFTPKGEPAGFVVGAEFGADGRILAIARRLEEIMAS